jgi:thiol-disulfide isomerase/thioredoxin
VRARMGRGTHSFAIRTLILTIFLAIYLWPLLGGSQGGQAAAVDLSGAPVDPLKAAGGKVVVLIFVRTDCPISNRYAPTIQRLSAQHAGKASFWLVYPDKAESAEAIRKHERDFHYELPALRDPRHALVKESRAQITPEAAVFDANHLLVYHGRIDNLYEDFGRARTAATTHELDDAIRAAIESKMLPADNAPAVGCYISDLE